MKVFVIALFLTCMQIGDTPVGIWKHKEDKSKIEIIHRNGKLFGSLISSENLHHKIGTELLRNVKFTDGKWCGEYYLYKNEQWVDVNLEIKEDILFLEYKYGFLTKNIHFYREQ